MDIVYRFQGEEFEWDSEKARSNIDKHGISFEEGVEVFFDPFYVTGDASPHRQDVRDFIIGYSLSLRLLLVIYTERGQRTRLISARPATRAERKVYEDG